MNFFSFCLFREMFVLSSFLKNHFTRYSMIGWQFFLSMLWIRHPFCFGQKSFCWEIWLRIIWGLPCMWWVAFLLLLSKFSFVYNFWQFSYKVYWWNFWVQTIWGLWVSWIWMSFPPKLSLKFGKFLAIVTLNVYFVPFFFSSPSGIPIGIYIYNPSRDFWAGFLIGCVYWLCSVVMWVH